MFLGKDDISFPKNKAVLGKPAFSFPKNKAFLGKPDARFIKSKIPRSSASSVVP
jgi:hypothetical protein